jgi:hypothetical protein
MAYNGFKEGGFCGDAQEIKCVARRSRALLLLKLILDVSLFRGYGEQATISEYKPTIAN